MKQKLLLALLLSGIFSFGRSGVETYSNPISLKNSQLTDDKNLFCAATAVTFVNGDYRTTGSGNWVSNNAIPAIWQRYNGTI